MHQQTTNSAEQHICCFFSTITNVWTLRVKFHSLLAILFTLVSTMMFHELTIWYGLS